MSYTPGRNAAVGQKAGFLGAILVGRWLWVAVPLAWGIVETFRASLALLR